MPQKIIPKCSQCDKTESIIWRSTTNGSQICNDCQQLEKHQEIKSDDAMELENYENGNGAEQNEDKGKTRKSTRSTRFKTAVKVNGKGRGRRFKRTPFKSPMVPAESRTVQSVFYNGSYLQVGDIVSLMDAKDNIYYAQVRGLLIDTYCEKSVYLTWLIPSTSSPPPNERFDPATYLIGPEEDSPRRIGVLEFVMHCPSNYFYDKNTPYPKPDFMEYDSKPTGFIWQSLTELATKRHQ